MRIWDLAPKLLCDRHLLGEHRELHGLWNILTLDKRGYRRHPETLRWVGKLAALFARHGALVEEMDRRGFTHRSPLDRRLARGRRRQDSFVHSIREQRSILRAKGCACLARSTAMTKPKPGDARAYMASLGPEQRKGLEAMRAAIGTAAPSAEPAFSYGMPSFLLQGQPLFWYAAWKQHFSLYPLTPAVLKKHAEELSGYRYAKGTLRFPASEPLPLGLVRKLVRARAAELRAEGARDSASDEAKP